MPLDFDIPRDELDAMIDAALREDGAHADATVSYLAVADTAVVARMVAAAHGVVAGVPVAEHVFARLDATIRFEARVTDGATVAPGDELLTVRGRSGGVLGGERVALNFMQRLSGVATLTSRFAERVRAHGIRILDTRKTTPGLRRLERYAVRAGDGRNHRFNLSDMILIKENHIRAVGGVEALRALLVANPAPVAVEVEVDSLECLRGLLGAPVNRIMLDNFTPELIREAIDMIRTHSETNPASAPEIEASGGITLDNIDRYAIAGLDYISIGALTHSAPAFDISMEVAGDGE